MEIRVVLRGALAGLVAGLLGFVFAKIFAEPLINKAIAYESGRDEILDKLNIAAGRPTPAEGPEIFSRHTQSTVGLFTGIVGFSIAMGLLAGVAYVVLHGRFRVPPRNLVWMIAGFGFFGVYLLPFVKYPANPPAIGHDFTIKTRGTLYLTMVIGSVVLLGLAVYAAYRLSRRFSMFTSVLIAGAGFLVLYGVLIGVLPSLGDLAANKAHADQFGYARSGTETPQAITNILSTPLTVDGRTIQPGQIVYPGFSADVLWKFRWYSLLNQIIVWTVAGLALGALVERYLKPPAAPRPESATPASAVL